MSRRSSTHLLKILLVLTLVGVAGFAAWSRSATPAVGQSSGEMRPVDLVKLVSPAVVTVINMQEVGGDFVQGSSEPLPAGSGSGFIIDDQGHVITNNHVVQGGQEFEVIYADGTKQPATLVGADPVSDLAVVQVSGTLPGKVALGDSNALQPGQDVLAIGSPLGSFSNTVTDGIVSGLGRSLPIDPSSPSVYTNLVQHDAPINPGNSGGPLFDLFGQVIGVNTIGIPATPDGVPAQGLFFAIPSNTVKKITDQLIATGSVTYPFLGIEGAVVAIDPVTAAHANLPVDHGVYVPRVVPDSPLAQAGVQDGDIITAIDGQPIDQTHPLEEFLFEYQPGDQVTLTIQRGDQQQDVMVTLGERPTSS